jgi:hypothetical protein
MTMNTETIDHDPNYVDPPHEVDPASAKVATMADAMSQIGWVGYPLLGVRIADSVQLLTGSHRLAAARIADISVPVYVVEAELLDAWIDDGRVDTWEAELLRTDDDGRLAVLREIGDDTAVTIMEHEIDVSADDGDDDDAQVNEALNGRR